MDFLQKISKRPSKLDSTGPSEHFSVSNFLSLNVKEHRLDTWTEIDNFGSKKVQLLFCWLSSTSLKKPKSITRQTPGCFASRSLVNMPFWKMETYCSERNFFGFLQIEIQKRSVFFGDLLLQGEKRSLWKGKIT